MLTHLPQGRVEVSADLVLDAAVISLGSSSTKALLEKQLP